MDILSNMLTWTRSSRSWNNREEIDLHLSAPFLAVNGHITFVRSTRSWDMPKVRNKKSLGTKSVKSIAYSYSKRHYILVLLFFHADTSPHFTTTLNKLALKEKLLPSM